MADGPEDANSKGGGRGRPPLRSRFQKGKSGNPNGRPPRSRDLKSLIEVELDEIVSVTENGRLLHLTKRQVLAKKLVNAAVRGEDKPIQTLLKFIGSGAEPEPVVAVDPAEIARFAMRYLTPPPEPNRAPGAWGDDEADAAYEADRAKAASRQAEDSA